MWKHPFLQGTEQTETLEFPRASAEEPEIRCMSCAAQGEHTSVFLGRLPWQSRCAKCKSSWQAQQINRYHTEVVQMAEYLPWTKHLRMFFKVSVEEGQEYIPVWSWAASEPTSKFPPASATPSQFPPASPAETGKAEGKSEEGSSGGGPQVAAEKPKFIQIPRVDDPVANLREALRAQLYAQIDLETAYEAFEKEKVFPDKGPLVEAMQSRRSFRGSRSTLSSLRPTSLRPKRYSLSSAQAVHWLGIVSQPCGPKRPQPQISVHLRFQLQPQALRSLKHPAFSPYLSK